MTKLDDKWATRPPVVRKPKLNAETVLSVKEGATVYRGLVTSLTIGDIDIIVMGRNLRELQAVAVAMSPGTKFDPNKTYDTVIMSKFDVKLDEEL